MTTLMNMARYQLRDGDYSNDTRTIETGLETFVGWDHGAERPYVGRHRPTPTGTPQAAIVEQRLREVQGSERVR